MHDIEPFYTWRDLYAAEEDPLSPFYGREYSEFQYSNTIYNFYIHPQWDDFGSPTLVMKIIFVDYEQNYAIIELMGEWNDAINNDIMILKRDIIEHLMENGIRKFILIGENVLNFHASDDCYYEEWFDELEDGWIALVNFRAHVIKEFQRENIDYYLVSGGTLNHLDWRTNAPHILFETIEDIVQKRIG